MTTTGVVSRRCRALLLAPIVLAGLCFRQAICLADDNPPLQPGDIVVAESHYGNGMVTGPVRAGSEGGLEVMLPHGTWVDCRTSCAETLRVETVDIFENKDDFAGYGTLQNECGIFGCLKF